MPRRTFLALDLDDMIVDALSAMQARVGECGAKMRQTPRDQLHVTLNFLGDVPDEKLADVCNRAADVAAMAEPFEFHLQGVGVVPPVGWQVKMVWAGVSEPTGQLVKLQADLAAAFAGMDLHEEERTYRPHITLARIKYCPDIPGLRKLVKPLQDKELGTQHAEEIVVYTSEFSKDGPVYTPIGRAKLGQK